MITFAFYTIHFFTKLFRLEDRLSSSDLENRLNLLFLLTEMYFLLTLLVFFTLLAFGSILAIPYSVIMLLILSVELIKRKPIMGKGMSKVYDDYNSITNTI